MGVREAVHHYLDTIGVSVIVSGVRTGMRALLQMYAAAREGPTLQALGESQGRGGGAPRGGRRQRG